MSRRFILTLGGVAIAMVAVGVASGQDSYYPDSNSQGYGGGQQRRGLDVGGGRPSALNQIALRNAQQLLQNSMQPSQGSSAARIGLGAGTSLSSTSKPFSNYSAPPTVSPYLNLFRVDLNGNQALNYNTLVQPQLQQQQVNQQLRQQQVQETNRLQALSARAEYNPQGSRELLPTGHETVYMYYGHYYTGAGSRPKKRQQ